MSLAIVTTKTIMTTINITKLTTVTLSCYYFQQVWCYFFVYLKVTFETKSLNAVANILTYV